MTEKHPHKPIQESILSAEQDVLLDMYIESLVKFYESIKEAEKKHIEIETLHLRRILEK